MRPRFSAIHFVKAKDEYLYHSHKHASFEMISPMKGVYKCLLNGTELSFGPGRVLLIQQGDVHQDIYLKGMEYCGCIFDFADASGAVAPKRAFKNGVQATEQLLRISDPSVLFKAESLLPSLSAIDDSPFSHAQLIALLTALLWEALGSAPRGALASGFLSGPERAALRRRLFRLFDANLSSGLSLAGMAKGMGMSESALSHKCAELLGAPPAKAFLEFRLRRAKALLQSGECGVKETARRFGFASEFHFSRVYRKLFGEAPSTCAKRAKG
jgi:AraC-like DNA-binding protein